VTPLWHVCFFACLIFAICVYSRVIFINWRRSSSADVNKSVFIWINCNFVMTVGLTNDKRCLTHNLRVEKHRGSEKKLRINEHIINRNCQSCSNSINIWCFTVCVPLDWRSWKGHYLFVPLGCSKDETVYTASERTDWMKLQPRSGYCLLLRNYKTQRNMFTS